MADKPKQKVVDSDHKFTRLYEDGHASSPFLRDSGNKLAATMRQTFPDILGDVEFSQGPVKSWDRAAAKLASETGTGLDISKTGNVIDIVRGRIVIDTPGQVRAIRKILNDPDQRAKMGIEHVKDRFAVPSDTHYRDINLSIRLENGHVAEVQINQRDMLAASEFIHDSYEDMDAIEKKVMKESRDFTKDEFASHTKFRNYTRDVHDYGASKVPGIDGLLNEKGRTKLAGDYAERKKADPEFKPGVTMEADTKYGVPFVSRAEIYGGEGYKALAKQYNIAPDRLEIDTSALEKPTIRWEAEGNSLIAQKSEILADMLERHGTSIERYGELGADIKIETPDGLKEVHSLGFLHNLGKNSGFIGGVAIGGLTAAFALANGSSKARAAEMLYEAAAPFGETQLDAIRGDVQAMKRSGTIETASNIGAAGGALAGAAMGTAIMPVVGTAVGAVVGSIGGGLASGEITALVYDNFETIKSSAVHISNEAAGALNMAARETANLWNWLRGHDEPENQLLLARLPTEIDDTAPPELQHLVEIKRLLVQAHEEGAAPGKIDSIEDMFDQACHTYEKSGALEMAVASLDQWERAEQMAQNMAGGIKNIVADSGKQPAPRFKDDLAFGR